MKKSKKVKKSNTWKIKQHRDQFFKRSKTLGYRSRASFKLIELNNKFNFINKNTNLLDLGSYPGGWSQVASQLISTGRILSIDIKKMLPIDKVKFINSDIFDDQTKKLIEGYFNGRLDVIISDMAADTTGNKSVDSIRTNELCLQAINLSTKILKKNGVFVSKLFMGEDFIELKNLAKSLFQNINFLSLILAERSQKKLIYIASF